MFQLTSKVEDSRKIRTRFFLVSKVTALISTVLFLSACEIGVESFTSLRRSSDDAGRQSGNDNSDKGGIAFNLSTLHEAAKKPGKDVLDTIDLVWTSCPEIPPPTLQTKDEEQTVSISDKECAQGQVKVDLKIQKFVEIKNLVPGEYRFTATAYKRSGEIKRGETRVTVVAGKVAQGSIVLQGLDENGSVIIEIIDGTDDVSPACAELERLSSSVEPAICRVGKFICRYGSAPISASVPSARPFEAESICSERGARLSILAELCSGNYHYEQPISCEHKDK
jgi:hypothetical protein